MLLQTEVSVVLRSLTKVIDYLFVYLVLNVASNLGISIGCRCIIFGYGKHSLELSSNTHLIIPLR